MTKENMGQKNEMTSATESRNSDSPFVFEFFLVQGASFRCMAYQDNDGKWRAAFNNQELPGTVRVLV
jgi:hypothetical protein